MHLYLLDISTRMHSVHAFCLPSPQLAESQLTESQLAESQLTEFTTGRKLAEKLKFQRMNFFQVQSLGINLNKLIVKEN